MKHIISLLMENEAGALSRVAGLFSARAYNIESLTVAPTEDATLSRMTIVTSGSDEVIEQIIKQLNKLVDVVKVLDLNDGRYIERELMLVKVKATGPQVINDESRWAMKEALTSIQNGEYAKRFILEGRTGYPEMTARRRLNAAHPIEQVGGKLRSMMPWISKNKLVDQSKN